MARRWAGVGLVLALAAGVVVVAVPAAMAGHCPGGGGHRHGGCIPLRDSNPGNPGSPPAPAPRAPAPGGPPGSSRVWEAVADTGPDGQPCWRVIGGLRNTGMTAAEAEAVGATMGMPRCVDGPGPPRPGEEWWDMVTLPDPQARVQPRDYAITGAAVYLMIDDAHPVTVTRVSPWGTTFEIRAVPEFTVHWGDGAVTPTSDTGRPWPGGPGEITHRYRDRAVVTIRVVTRWNATLTTDGVRETLPVFTSEATIDDYPVREVQAVRHR